MYYRRMTDSGQGSSGMSSVSEYYRDLMEMANSIVLILSPAGKITYINQYGADFFGFARDELVGQKILGTILPESDSAGRRHSRLIKSICSQPELYVRNENENVLRSGERVWIAWTNKALQNDSGMTREILSVGNDITARKTLEMELKKAKDLLEEKVRERTEKLDRAYSDLKSLTVRLAAAEETEKKRISREIHDQIGQNLSTIGLNLNLIRSAMEKGSAKSAGSIIDDSLSLLRETTERVRNILSDLRLPVLDDYGLLAALKWYAGQLRERTEIDIAVDGDEILPRPEAHVESTFFLIAREALANVAKHAEATAVSVEVRLKDGVLSLSVRDNGKGYRPARGRGDAVRRGLGLLSMSERALLIGGVCRVASRPGKGTNVIVEVPL